MTAIASPHDLEKIQRLAARVIATHPAGRNLLLIGGFRYRLLNQSARVSRDVDYHWEGDLDQKQKDLLKLCRRALLPQVRRDFGYSGDARVPTGPEFDSVNARFIELRFWKAQHAASQVVLPLEITRIVCLDPATIRTAEGVVYPTPSDLDLIEGKILAVLNRVFVEHRDFVDIFLYGDHLTRKSPERLREKLRRIPLDAAPVLERLQDLRQNMDFHSRAVQAVIDTQLDPVTAGKVNDAGGGLTMFRRAFQLVESNVQL